MGLLTKEVEITLNNNTIKYYESLGYEIPRKKGIYGKFCVELGTKIKVMVKDLPNGSSSVLLQIQCDHCGKILNNIAYRDYINRSVKNNGLYYCRECGGKLIGNVSMKKTKLKNSMSFFEWCLNNKREDILERWDYNLNNCNPKDICYCSDKKYYFKCPENLHESQLFHISRFVSGKANLKCSKCNSFGNFLVSNYGGDAIDKYWDFNKNLINPFEISRGSNKQVWINCQLRKYHDSYLVACSDFISGNRCPYCRGLKVHSLDSLGKNLEERNLLSIWSEKNKKSPYEYSLKSNKKVWWKCNDNKHKDFYRSIISSYNICEFRCPNCVRERDESFLQEKVRTYLTGLNFHILHERDCTIVPKNPKTNCFLPFDNEVIDLKLIIEVMGIQHYEITGFHYLHARNKNNDFEYEFKMQKVRDRYKKLFALSKGYSYLEVPYWADDESETWKKLIDSKIKDLNE